MTSFTHRQYFQTIDLLADWLEEYKTSRNNNPRETSLEYIKSHILYIEKQVDRWKNGII